MLTQALNNDRFIYIGTKIVALFPIVVWIKVKSESIYQLLHPFTKNDTKREKKKKDNNNKQDDLVHGKHDMCTAPGQTKTRVPENEW